jgi:hypothetical protein
VTNLNRLTRDDFDARIGDMFGLYLGGDETLSLELVSSESLPSGIVDDATRTPFSLIFRSAGVRTHVPQRIYTVSHDELGAMQIFLVPIGPDDGGMRYEAVFT